MMRKIKAGRLITSLFSKLLLIIFATGFLINLLVAGFFLHALRRDMKEPYQQNAINYVNYLIQDIGTPPSFARAQKIAGESFLHISYESPEMSWATSKAPFQSSPPLRWRTIYESKDILIKSHHWRKLIRVYRNGGYFTFMMERNFKPTVKDYFRIVILVFLLTVVLCSAYLLIRRVLRPVKWLHEGVNQVAGGNLDHSVPEGRSDELGRLSEAFNAMTNRIRRMIQDRDQLLLDVSHELRTPLTRMKVALEFLPKDRAEKNIREDALEMENMITAILEEARLRHASGRLEKKRINPADLINEVVQEYRDRPPCIQTDIPNDGLDIEIEPELIKIVLRNLLNNAIKYSEPSGPPVELALLKTAGQIHILIQDRGVGIPDQDLPHIFEPFYRVDKSRSRRTGGYGIGLSLCKTIMDAHQGKIEVSSTSGKGTLVKIIFNTSILQ